MGRVSMILGVFTFALTIVWSIPYGIGVALPAIRADLGISKTAASLLFSVAAAIYFGLAWIAGIIMRWLPAARILCFAACCFLAGLVIFSFSNGFLSCLIWYSVGCGLGLAAMYTPILTVVAGLRSGLPTTRLSIATVGVGLGTVVGPVVVGVLIEYGWRDTYRVLGVGGFAATLLCAVLARTVEPAMHAGNDGRSINWTNRSLWYLFISSCIASSVFYLPVVHFPEDLLATGASFSSQSSLVALFGGVSVACRPLFGILGRGQRALYRSYALTFLSLGLGCASWAFASGIELFVVSAVFFGIGYGGFVGLSAAMAIVADVGGSAALRIGIFMGASGVGALVGSPLVAFLFDSVGRSLTFVILCILCGIGLWLATLLSRLNRVVLPSGVSRQ